MAEIILTWMEMGKYGDISDFKKIRGRRGGGGTGRVLGEDKGYVR